MRKNIERMAQRETGRTLRDDGSRISKLETAQYPYVSLTGAETAAGVKTFTNGISFGNETLSAYDEGTWTPVITGTGSNPTVTYTNQLGRYTRTGNVVFYSLYIQIDTISGGSGDVRISIPVAAASGNSNNTIGSAQLSGPDVPGTPINLGTGVLAGTSLLYIFSNQDNAAIQALAVSGLAAGDFIVGSGFYFV